MTNLIRPLKIRSSTTVAIGATSGQFILTGTQDAALIRASAGVTWGFDAADKDFPLNLNEVFQYAIQGQIYMYNPGAAGVTIYIVELEA